MSGRLLLGSALLAMAAALFGTLGVVTRNANELGVGPLPFVAWRAGLATIALVGVTALVAARGRSPLPQAQLMARDRRIALVAACVLGASLNLAVFAAFLLAPIALVLITFYTFPAMVALAAVPLYGERLDRLRLGALLLSSGGLALVVAAPLLDGDQLRFDPLGIGLAAFGAVCQAAFILLSARGFAPLRSLHVAAYVVAGASLISVIVVMLFGELPGLLLPLSEPRAWVWLLAGGIAGAAIPTTAMLAGMGMIGPTRTAILMTLEPLVGVVLAAAFLGETPAPLQLLGGAGVLAAAAILQVSPRAPVPAEPEYAHPV